MSISEMHNKWLEDGRAVVARAGLHCGWGAREW